MATNSLLESTFKSVRESSRILGSISDQKVEEVLLALADHSVKSMARILRRTHAIFHVWTRKILNTTG